ncbi:hypothetical protein ACE1SV_68540 [Streptomyces sp. E-15]
MRARFRLPFGNAARAIRTVSAAISAGPSGRIDLRAHPHTKTSASKTTVRS